MHEWFFMYAITVVINLKEIKNHSERISSNLSHFAEKNWWKEISLSDQKYCKEFDLINENIALNILFSKKNEAEIKRRKVMISKAKETYFSKFNLFVKI